MAARNVQPNDVFEFVVSARADGKGIDNVMHFVATPTVPGDIVGTTDEVLVALRLLWRDNMLAYVTDAYVVSKYILRTLNDKRLRVPAPPVGSTLTPYLLTYAEINDVAGAGADDTGDADPPVGPNFVSLGGIKKTGQAGKSGRGGFHIGPVPDASVDANVPNATVLTAFTASLIVLKTPVEPLGTTNLTLTMGIFSRKAFLTAAPIMGAVEDFFKPLISFGARSLTSSSLRRKRKS